VPNDYSRQWFEVFLETMPSEWSTAEVDGVCRRLPLPAFRRVLDICCGPGRHARAMAARGYEITGLDRDVDAIEQARMTIRGEFKVLDQRDLWRLTGAFDAAMILWQSFGYFEPTDNDQVLVDVAALLRPGGRLLLDLFHADYFETRQGRTASVRDHRCLAITNTVAGTRLTSRIEYVDGTEESMDWELFTPETISARAARVGLEEIERCTWWDEARAPSPDQQRFQMVLRRA
jgi:SAM-dependent methyltransferase